MIMKIENVVVVDWQMFRYLEDTNKECTGRTLQRQNQRHIYLQRVYLDHERHRRYIWLCIQSSLALS